MARWYWGMSETWLLFRTPVVVAQKQMLRILCQFDAGHYWQLLSNKNGARKLTPVLWICVCVCSSVKCLEFMTESLCISLSLSVLCFVFVVQVEAGWLPGKLLDDSTHSEHLSQPRQSPSLSGLLCKAHRSVRPRLWVTLWGSECAFARKKKKRKRGSDVAGDIQEPPHLTIFF